MDDYKNTTKTVYLSGGGAVKGRSGAAGFDQTMRKFKDGTLHATPEEIAAVERGNRNQVLEAADAGVLRRPARRGVPVAPREPLIKRACGGLAVMPGKKR